MIERIYISDLDGTLLNKQAELSEFSYETLRGLLRRGLPFSVATARTHYTVVPILRDLPITIPLILQNGAILYDMQTRRILDAAEITPAAFSAVCEAMEQHGVNGFVYCAEDGALRCCYRELTNELMRQFYQERRDHYEKPFYQVGALRDLAKAHPVYVSANAPQAVLQPVAEKLRGIAGLNLSYYQDVYHEGIWYLEISAADANKQNGVARLKALCGAAYATGFGDNANDLPLFAACDRKIAVQNAAQCLKEQADLVIGSNESDAVARYLSKEWRQNP